MLLGGDPCDEHSVSTGGLSYQCLAGGGAGGRPNNNSDTEQEEAPLPCHHRQQQAQQQLQQSLIGEDSPPTSPGGSRERRFPAVGTPRYLAPEVEFDSRFGVQVRLVISGICV